MKPLYLTVALSAGLSLGSLLAGKPMPLGSLAKENVLDPHSQTEAESPESQLQQAQTLANEAKQLAQQSSVTALQEAKVKWRQAINRLDDVPHRAKEFADAQRLLTAYRPQLAAVRDRLTREEAAQRQLEEAQTLGWQATMSVRNPPRPIRSWQRAQQRWREAITLLEAIAPGTSAYQTAQKKLDFYRKNYQVVQQQLGLESQAIVTLNIFSQVATELDQFPMQVMASMSREPVGLSYGAYAQRVQALEDQLAHFSQQPGATQHPIYATLTSAVSDYQAALNLWDRYLAHQQANRQWLYDDFFNQMVPVSAEQGRYLEQKYQTRTYTNYQTNGHKVSLAFTVWDIWDSAHRQIRRMQQQVTPNDLPETQASEQPVADAS